MYAITFIFTVFIGADNCVTGDAVVRKLSFRALPQHQGVRLDQLLAEWLPEALQQPVSKGKVRKLIVAGAVYLNGKRVRIASKALIPGARIEVYVDEKKLFSDERGKDQPFVMSESRILFEDEHLIVVDKPPGLPTQPTLDEARDNLFASLKKFLSQRAGGDVYLGLHHRLDRDTSGVVLFTKAKEANAGVSDLFASHRAIKIYQALVALPAGRVSPDEWVVENYLGRAKGTGKRTVFTSVRSGGDFARTDFRLVEKLRAAVWVEARPKTGRTHQIRVHLSEGGYPILGDSTYGGKGPGIPVVPRLMLHASSLIFPHPITRAEIHVQSPLPDDFSRCLQGLRPSRPE